MTALPPWYVAAVVDDNGADEPSRDVVAAIGKASEAMEYVERARGHLFTLHQLIGRADLLMEDAVEMLAGAGLAEDAAVIDREIVGRNVLDGRWTFQIVEEFEETYYRPVVDAVRRLEVEHLGGRRHLHETLMKEERRTRGVPGHERAPTVATEQVSATSAPGDERVGAQDRRAGGDVER